MRAVKGIEEFDGEGVELGFAKSIANRAVLVVVAIVQKDDN